MGDISRPLEPSNFSASSQSHQGLMCPRPQMTPVEYAGDAAGVFTQLDIGTKDALTVTRVQKVRLLRQSYIGSLLDRRLSNILGQTSADLLYDRSNNPLDLSIQQATERLSPSTVARLPAACVDCCLRWRESASAYAAETGARSPMCSTVRSGAVRAVKRTGTIQPVWVSACSGSRLEFNWPGGLAGGPQGPHRWRQPHPV